MPVIHRSRSGNGKNPHHLRGLSSGGSKIGLKDAQLSQKDIPPQRLSQLKRVGNSAVELHDSRTSSPLPKASGLRVQSKDHLAGAQQKRAHTLIAKRSVSHPQKNGFALAQSLHSDEEWVSSGSDDDTAQDADHQNDEHRAMLEDQESGDAATAKMSENSGHAVNPKESSASAPRADSNMVLLQPEYAQPDASSQTLSQTQEPAVRMPPQSTPASPLHEPPALPEEPPLRHSRSEAPSPTRLRQGRASKRHSLHGSMMRQGEAKPELRLHPLMRGHVVGAAIRPSPLAPLTISEDMAQVQLSASPTSTRIGSRPGSPIFSHASATQIYPPETVGEGKPLSLRRNISTTSLQSVATVPASSTAVFTDSRVKPDRLRTLSMFTVSSSSAALSSLTRLPTTSRPATPPLTIHFPSERRRDHQEECHQLLPPQFRVLHMTVLSKSNPLFDSYERIVRAKRGG